MRNLFEIFVQPEENQTRNPLMIIEVMPLEVAKGHMETEVVVVMGAAHMGMIMALNLVIVRNLQMVMDLPVINIIHIIIITMVTMIGTDERLKGYATFSLAQFFVDKKNERLSHQVTQTS